MRLHLTIWRKIKPGGYTQSRGQVAERLELPVSFSPGFMDHTVSAARHDWEVSFHLHSAHLKFAAAYLLTYFVQVGNKKRRRRRGRRSRLLLWEDVGTVVTLWGNFQWNAGVLKGGERKRRRRAEEPDVPACVRGDREGYDRVSSPGPRAAAAAGLLANTGDGRSKWDILHFLFSMSMWESCIRVKSRNNAARRKHLAEFRLWWVFAPGCETKVF